ncbi:MAG: hypothetical protein IJO21_06330 [Oscillospiraceae bacterium]|nr:hypothetical protein [Oscillospiraceae bacterium]MBQ7130637.1 hypothetical protein [Oscillospiraceae bacterium]
MNRKVCFTLWGCLFILCAGLGFIPEPEGFVKKLMTLLSLIFFLPPALLLYRAGQCGDSATAALIRNLSALSLGLTVSLLVANFLTVPASDALGNILHYVLIIVSSPMFCSGYWALSLFFWACLLVASLQNKR